MTTKSYTRFYPKIKGDSGYFSPEGFSKGIGKDYNVMAHIAELRDLEYEGEKIHAKAQFQIISVTTVETVIDL